MARAVSRGGGSLAVWLALAAVVAVLDQFTKQLILGHYRLGDATYVTSFFNVVRAHNTGAAFSFLAGAGGWQRWFFTVLALGVSGWIVFMLRSHAGQKLLSLALALIMGGALGNVIDRALYGHVIDFLDFHLAGWHWPAFNVADSGITVGAVLLVLDSFRKPGKP